MRLTDEMIIEFDNIQARLKRIHDGEYLDRSAGIMGEKFPENDYADIYMGPLQIQEQGCKSVKMDTLIV